MDYITYLRINNLNDNADNFISYLIEVKEYTPEQAKKYSCMFYELREI